MDLEEIRKVIELIKEHDLSYFNLESGDTKIKLKRGADFDALEEALNSQAAAARLPAVAATAEVAGASADSSAGDAAPAEPQDDLVDITSPMVGTFYSSPDPDSDAFVSIGSQIESETVVCIVEAMKVMNEIQAEMSGTVVKVVAKDAQPVQFGEVLFRIKPD